MNYKHKEAFALMWYACPCGHRERIWNSRDGVTPFGGLQCSSCGDSGFEGGLCHTNFELDDPQPSYRLVDGQQFFRDGTPYEAECIVKKRLEHFVKVGYSVSSAVEEKLLYDARRLAGEWQTGWPMIDRFMSNSH